MLTVFLYYSEGKSLTSGLDSQSESTAAQNVVTGGAGGLERIQENEILDPPVKLQPMSNDSSNKSTTKSASDHHKVRGVSYRAVSSASYQAG